MAADTEPPADDALLREVYDDLRDLAARHLSRERAGHTLQPTALAHEAWLRMSVQRAGPPPERSAFLAAASTTIRRVLVDHARARGAAKRGGDAQRVEAELVTEDGARAVDLMALDDALGELATLQPRQARVVELRFFGGLGGDEVAEVLGVSPRTVDNDWRVARAWLAARLADGPA